MDKQYTVTVRGKAERWPAGTTYEDIAEAHRAEYDADILLVSRGGKLRELHRPLRRDCELRLITAKEQPGWQTLERSLILLFLKAYHDVLGPDAPRVCVDHSVSTALFIRAADGSVPDAALLHRIQARMEQLRDAALPIRKRDMETWDAVAYFRAHGMPDKAEALRCRIGSTVNVYELDGFVDYFYGYMTPNTRYLKCFALASAPHGLYLRLPSHTDPERLGDFAPSVKVAEAQYGDSLRADRIGIPNVGALNSWITRDRARDIILAQEALMEKRIGDIAQEIAARPDVRFVMIAGPSSSGKTSFSHRLSTQLRAVGLTPHAIAADNYFKNRDETPRDENGNYDFECLEAMDVEGFNRDMLRLLRGETVEMPTYNFKKGIREYSGQTLNLGPGDVLVIEGIHCLNDRFSHALPAERKFKIYVSCLTTLNIDDHNRIPTTDARLLRRMTRDARTRGYGAAATISMWPSVRRGEENNIFPYQDSADAVFSSALIYEISVLRPYIEPLLYAIEPDDPAYIEARRLLKFLSYFLPVPADVVPGASIVREFIGGSFYNV